MKMSHTLSMTGEGNLDAENLKIVNETNSIIPNDKRMDSKENAFLEISNDITDSENDLKVKLKPLESELDHRNTSTSNAGESEYESANEEELVFNVATTNEISKKENSNKNDLETVDPSTTISDEKVNNENSINQHQLINEQSTLHDTYDSYNNNKNNNDNNGININIMNNNNNNKEDGNDVEDENSNNNNDEHLEDKNSEMSIEELSQDEEDLIENIEEDSISVNDENEINDSEHEHYEEEKNDQNHKIIQESVDGEDSNILPECSNISNNLADGKQVQTSVKTATKTKAEIAKTKRNPQYIPRKGSYFEHDDRGNDNEANKKKTVETMNVIDEEEENDPENSKLKSKKKLLSMKLCSDEMIGSETENVSKEKHDPISQSNHLECEGLNEKFEPSKNKTESKRKSIWDSSEKWHHDMFNSDDQKPKTREELINTYGYDIRTETEAPRLNRRSKYGKGPQRYSRKSDDENAYAKKTLRKVIKSSNNNVNNNSRSSTNEINDGITNNTNSKQEIKRDRLFEKRLNCKENDNHNDRSKNISKDNNAKQHRNNNDNTRIFENDRIFTNKSGQSSFKYSSNNDKSSKQTASIPNSKESLSNKIQDNVEQKNSDINKNKETNNNPIFSSEDFPALISSATTTMQTSKNQSSNSMTTSNNNIAQANEASNNKSNGKVIYYQKSNSSQENESLKRINNDTHTSVDSLQPELKSRDVNENYRQNSQSVESLQFENSRFSRNKVNTSLHYYNQNWNTNNRNTNQKTIYNNSNHTNRKYSENNDSNAIHETNDDSMTKRYSSMRQQQQRNLNIPPSVNLNTNNNQPQPPLNQAAVNPQFISLNNEECLDPTAKNATYYDHSNTAGANELTSHPQQTTNLMASGTGHHTHNYAPINGSTGTAATATPAAAPPYMPATANALMAYYDPNSTPGQTVGSAAATGLQGPIGLTQAYFTTDQSGAAQAAAQNYYLTSDLTAVAYHSAAYLQPNYPQTLASSHHTHQSHVANRYLNTTPSGTATSAESNRYLQTTPPNQNSTSILMTGNLAGQSYSTTMPTAFPSGYPQFPPQAQSASSPLPAGYPNVQLASSNNTSTSSNSTQAQTPSGYPELYRGGITYYDIPSQQQAMQRIQQNANNQQPSTNRRTKSIHGHQQPSSQQNNANNELNKGMEDSSNETSTTTSTNITTANLDSSAKHTSNAANEIQVNN